MKNTDEKSGIARVPEYLYDHLYISRASSSTVAAAGSPCCRSTNQVVTRDPKGSFVNFATAGLTRDVGARPGD